MKNKIIGAILIALFIIALITTATFIYLSLFHDNIEKNSATKNSGTILQELNKTKKDIDLPLETTILEVKASKNILATEVIDYENAKKINFKESNNSKFISKCQIKQDKKPLKPKVFNDKTARLVIIMDDIGNSRQVQHLKELGMKITPSIFPSTKSHPNTPKFAKSFKCYMVHVPMEAYHFNRVEENTLKVSDSLNKIDQKISSIHKDFPNAVAINNHTGSKFTSNIEAMDRLFCTLNKYHIHFIDSKTAPHTLGEKMQKIHKSLVYTRDVFLDNKPDVDYIITQILKAVKKAKRKGFAIAICHPRKETFKALKSAKNLLEDVKLIYAKELYE
ncbi:MAG: divergent polysaccharide deacetylase family protein [Sulfurospirillum sp.]|nr:MAG: divergent polysaccharide deacetylase family protein [Sulfurospirillum sp.]